MTCGHCTSTVESATKNIPGVEDVRADFTENTAVVHLKDPSNHASITPALVDAIESVGFDASVRAAPGSPEAIAAAATFRQEKNDSEFGVTTSSLGTGVDWPESLGGFVFSESDT